MKFLELNKKRHATKHFTDKPVDPKDVRTAIEIATLVLTNQKLMKFWKSKTVSAQNS